MSYANFPRNWLSNLNLKLFAMNHKDNSLPNLWCIYKDIIDLVLIATNDQQIYFVIEENNKKFGITMIYASTSYIHMRELWNTFQPNKTDIPWCFVGDFNAIMEAREFRGSSQPAIIPM